MSYHLIKWSDEVSARMTFSNSELYAKGMCGVIFEVLKKRTEILSVSSDCSESFIMRRTMLMR